MVEIEGGSENRGAPLVDVRTPIGPNVGANHAALGADHPAT